MTAGALHPLADTAALTSAAVSARGLTKVIDDRVILDGITFETPPQSCVALLGANGAGKSTLLKILAGLVAPTRGEALLLGQPVGRPSPGARAMLGLIGHGAMLYRDLSARENLVFFGRLYGVRDAGRRADELLAYVGLAGRARDPLRTFSRGMAQRVSIARALVHDPQVLLADEPFAGLDAPARDLLERLVRRLHAAGKTVILAGHDIGQSLDLAGRALVLRRGRLVVDEATDRLTAGAVLAEVSAP